MNRFYLCLLLTLLSLLSLPTFAFAEAGAAVSGMAASGMAAGSAATADAVETQKTGDAKKITDAQKVVMILDASGSMWGQIKSRAKIDIAKNVVRDLVKDWDPNTELGLTAYGHRAKGDCADIESLIPVSKVEGEKFSSVLDQITPKGKTPLSEAVIQAAKELRFTENAATVILISDGIETCAKDPCAVGRELEKAGVDFTAHIVGFDISKTEDQAQLKCLAENTGGEYFAAADAASLKDALSKAVEKVVAPVAVAPPVPKKPKATTGMLEVVATLTKDSPPLDRVYWKIMEAQADSLGRRKTVRSFTTSQIRSIPVAPGKYLVEASRDGAGSSAEIEIVAGEKTPLKLVFGSAEVRLNAVLTEGSAPLKSGVYWKVYGPADGLGRRKVVHTTTKDIPTLTLPPGEYLLEATHRNAKGSKEVSLKSGELNQFDISLNAGELRLVAYLDKDNSTPLKRVYWKLYNKNDDPLGRKEVAYSTSNDRPTTTISAGTYIAEVKKDSVVSTKEITVVAGKAAEEAVTVNAAMVRLVAKAAENAAASLKGTRWSVFDAKEDGLGRRKTILSTRQDSPIYALPPGDYLAVVKYDSKEAGEKFSVKSGESRIVEVVMD